MKLDRKDLEVEFRKVKELKRKSEQYAIEAKQTAQRQSAENYKLREDLSKECHHNELTHKSIVRELEEIVDKNISLQERTQAKLEVFEVEVAKRARHLALSTAIQTQYHGMFIVCSVHDNIIPSCSRVVFWLEGWQIYTSWHIIIATCMCLSKPYGILHAIVLLSVTSAQLYVLSADSGPMALADLERSHATLNVPEVQWPFIILPPFYLSAVCDEVLVE